MRLTRESGTREERKEVLGKGCVWIKRGSGKGRMGFRGRFSQLRGHRQRRTGRRKWGDIRDSREGSWLDGEIEQEEDKKGR